MRDGETAADDHLTATVVALKVGKDTILWDSELTGFGVRVYPNGTKVYVVQTRAGGKSKRIAIGRHGVISPDQARRKAAQMIARIKAGEDPDRYRPDR